DEYRDQIINNINASLASHQQHVVEPNDINYSQILQYGLKGCGITTQYNMNSVLANRELPIFGDHDVQSADLLTGWIVEITDEASNDVRKIMLTPEQAESLMYDGEPLADVLKMPEVTLSTLYRDPCPFGKPV
ncbi:MAG: hypothetical protein EBU90_25800, partial [Proteobacteria bacterium]|nr:hypothetical protein [Pseudomonadota bacterium]